MGEAAARTILADIAARLQKQERVRIIFAAAPSQASMLAGLVEASHVDWSRVDAFHMDEYIGLPEGSPAGFGAWLSRSLFDHLPFGSVHLISPADDPAGAAERYATLLAEHPIDVVCCGVGVNGHLAFNDPHVADFHDPLDVKVVQLDAICRQQQVDDGCFPTVDDVPREAITLTIPRLVSADRIVCVAPGASKAEAVRAIFQAPYTTEWPCVALRDHGSVDFFFDQESARLLEPRGVRTPAGPDA